MSRTPDKREPRRATEDFIFLHVSSLVPYPVPGAEASGTDIAQRTGTPMGKSTAREGTVVFHNGRWVASLVAYDLKDTKPT